MFRTVSATAKQCSRLIRTPMFNRRGFALVNDYSVRKRMTIGLSGFAVAAVGCYVGGRKIYRNRKAKKVALATTAKKEEEVGMEQSVLPIVPETPVVEKEPQEEVCGEEPIMDNQSEEGTLAVVEEEKPVEEAMSEETAEEITEVEDEVYNPWWTGVKEIALFLNNDDITLLDEHFPATRPYKPQRKVMLSYNPRPEDANEFGPVMGDEVEVKVLAMVCDEHAQVLVVDIGNTESAYRYPHIVLSCDDEDRAAAYSSVYGRLLVDRCVTDGLLVEDGPNVYVPKEDVEDVVIEGYYSYPETHVTVKDLRSDNITLKTKLCTARGMNSGFDCAESKNNRECSWCVFMKSGPCYKPFDIWQKCILENQQDADSFIVNCGEITMALKKCVDAHPEYYGKMSQPETSSEESVEEVSEDVSNTIPEEVSEGSGDVFNTIPEEVNEETENISNTIPEVSEETGDISNTIPEEAKNISGETTKIIEKPEEPTI